MKNYISNFIPNVLKKNIKSTTLFGKYSEKTGDWVKYSEIENVLNIAPPVLLNNTYNSLPRVAIVRTNNTVLSNGYVYSKSSWLRYERFCKTNNIPYDFFDITKSDWLEEAKKFDLIICHTPSTPSFQEMIESKIYILEKIMGKMCFPNYHEVWQYEHKVRANYLYQCNNLPTIPTVVTHSAEEALDIVDNTDYPFITKTTIGASSSGVTLVKTKSQAIQRVKKIFDSGIKTQFPYQKQKDYFYIQKFIQDATFDLRIMIVGNKAFGYYRYPKKGDFKASGSGIVDKKAIPMEALLLAVKVRNKLNSRQLGVDLLYSNTTNQYYIIETSLFNQIDTPVQLVVDGVAGYYDISDIQNITFKPGKFWIQEVMLKELFDEWCTKLDLTTGNLT